MEKTKSLSPSRVIRFGVFQVNLAARELRKHGVRVRLPGQPFCILSMLLERPGEIVTREEMRQRLWPSDTFVDFEHSLNSAIKKLRAALGDTPENSRYIETVPRVGYRFIAPVAVLDSEQAGIAAQTGASVAQQSAAIPTTEPEKSEPSIGVARGRFHLIQNKSSLVFVVTAVALGALYLFRPTVAPPRVVRIRQITHLGTVEAHQNLVTDGPRLYFRDRAAGTRSLKYVSTDGGEAHLLPNSSSEFDIDGISPDGSSLLVSSVTFQGNNPVWVLPTGGGSPRRLGNTMSIDSEWSPDGRRLAYMTADDGVYVTSADGSEARKLADVPGTPYCPRWSPDSKRLRFVVIRSETGPIDLWEVAADGKGGPHPLLPGWGKPESEWGGSWSPDGKYYFFSSSVQGVKCVWALRQKTDWWHRLNWVPVQLTSGPISYSLPQTSRDGKTLFVVGEERRGELLRYDSKSRTLVSFLPKFSADHVSFSKDGQWMAYVQYPEGILWRSKLDGTESLQLTAAPIRAYLPRWSPDGQWIAFAGVPALGEPPKLYRVRADGLTTAEQLVEQGTESWSLDWSPDGNAVVFDRTAGSGAAEAADIATLDLMTKKVEALPGSQGLQAPQWSPDGRYLAARAIGSKRLKLYDSRSGQWMDLGLANTDYESWSLDGKYIYFNTFLNRQDPSIFRMRIADRKLERIYTSKDAMLIGIYGLWSGVAPDGSLLILRDAGSRDIYAIDVELP